MRANWIGRTVGGTAVLALPIVVIAVLASTFAGPTDLRVVVNFLITLVFVLAIQSFSGNSGIVSFGHVAFMGVGAYAAALLTMPTAIKQSALHLPGVIDRAAVPPIPAVLAGAAVAGIVAGIVGLPIVRMHEDAMAMATFAVLVIFFVVFTSWDAVTGGAIGIYGIPTWTTAYSAVAFGVIGILVTRAFRESKAGLKLRASSTDAMAAEALGANVVRLRWIAWTLSGALMGMGGAIWAQYNLAFSPLQFYYTATFTFLSMLVVGGLASVSGAVTGALVVSFAFEVLRRVEGTVEVQGLQQMVVAFIILVMLYYRPSGLVGRLELDELLARRASRGRSRRG